LHGHAAADSYRGRGGGDDVGAAVRWVASGTFTGRPFQGIQPTGRRIEPRGVDYMEISDGLIKKNTIFYDGAEFARQIGMLPARDTVGERLLLAAFNARVRLRSLLRRRQRSAPPPAAPPPATA
jgi:SnoaL-like polyketide cyclase